MSPLLTGFPFASGVGKATISSTSGSPTVAAVAITTPLVDAGVASLVQDSEQSTPSVPQASEATSQSATSTKAPSAAGSWSRLLGGKLV